MLSLSVNFLEFIFLILTDSQDNLHSLSACIIICDTINIRAANYGLSLCALS